VGCGQAFVQVAILYFSIWYKKNEVATRIGEASPMSQKVVIADE